MYILHYAPDNASLIIRLALEELGLPYRAALVDRPRRAQDGPAYRAINPLGLIPALETPQGALFETGAILLWLSEAQGRLVPPPGDPERGHFLKWLFFVSNTAHADLRMVFYPQNYVGGDPAAQQALHETVTARMRGHLAQLDDLAAGPAPWFGAQEPTVLDFYVVALLRWSALYARLSPDWFRIAGFPALRLLAERLEARPAAQAVADAEGLGALPFSAPSMPTPPEGSPV